MRNAFETRHIIVIEEIEQAIQAAAESSKTSADINLANTEVEIYLENLGYSVSAIKGKKQQKRISWA